MNKWTDLKGQHCWFRILAISLYLYMTGPFSLQYIYLWKKVIFPNLYHCIFIMLTLHLGHSVYEGDSLTLLLFCVGMNPLSQIITKSEYRYRYRTGATISHIIYMDDIKLYARNERYIDALIHTIRLYRNDIGMSFRLCKC